MKRIMTIQDICSVGKCSGTVALPIISAAGVETAIIPTAVLSTHTMFSKYTFCDLTPEIQKISDTLNELNLDFDAVYTGYLGSFEQLSLISDFIDRFKTEKTTVVIDPVMADNGKLYPGFTPEFAAEMTKLVSKADLVIPNLTEVSFMLNIPYPETYDEVYVRDVLRRLTSLASSSAARTKSGRTLTKAASIIRAASTIARMRFIFFLLFIIIFLSQKIAFLLTVSLSSFFFLAPAAAPRMARTAPPKSIGSAPFAALPPQPPETGSSGMDGIDGIISEEAVVPAVVSEGALPFTHFA